MSRAAGLHNPQFDRVCALYRTMPGAPMPPSCGGFYLWGEVTGNDHWAFCEAIIREIDRATGGRK